MITKLKDLFERAEEWPETDQEELVALAEKIENRQEEVYHATEEELLAIDEAKKSGIASQKEVRAAFAAFRGHDKS